MKIEIDKFKLIKNAFQDHKLKDCIVVVDAHNFFYNSYRNSNLPYKFGCECDGYAKFLKEYLSMFKKANVKCFFIFKGGHENMNCEIKKSIKTPLDIPPIFMKETYKQVLDEMGFDYVNCEYGAKKHCIALAQKLNCPVISYDRDLCYSNVPYIPYNSLIFKNNAISCKIFRLKNFYEKYRVTYDKFVIFIVLMNDILPESSLQKLFNDLKVTDSNASLLKWLSKTTRGNAINKIFSCLSTNEREEFLSSEKLVKAFLSRQETEGVPIDYFEKGEDIIDDGDPLWFEKGVACRHIAIPYINLYRWNILWGSWAIEDPEADDAMTLSLEIVKYAYNLLTNFQKQTFSLHSENGEVKEIIASQDTPVAQSDCVFQNGWRQLDGAALFHKFLIDIFGHVPVDALSQLPEDTKLLMISLAYFSRMKRVNIMNEVYSIVLSYIMLGVVHEIDNDTVTMKSLDSGKELLLDNLINKANFKTECSETTTSMISYFKLCDGEIVNIIDRKLLHCIAEFQHCLEHINFLNRLCGSPYKPTIYRKTFNGTLVYKMLHTLKGEDPADGITFLNDKLQSTPIILEYFNCVIALYKKMI